jgi:O-antigen/teichoic acid export membrane protein
MSLYSRGKARKSLIDTVLFRAVSQVATVLSFSVMVRGMTKEAFGIYSLFYSFIPVVGTLASLGLEQVLRRYQPEYLKAGNIAAAAWLSRLVAMLRLGTNLVFLGIVLLVWNYIAPHIELAGFRIEFEFFCLIILLYFQTQILQLSLSSHMLHRYSVGSIAVLSVTKLVGYAVLYHLGALTLRAAIWVDVAGYAAAYGFMRVMCRSHCESSEIPRGYKLPQDERRRMTRYAIFNNFNDAGTLMLDSRTDNFFIAGFLNAVSVGVYASYMRLNEMAANLMPVRLFENVIQPMFFSIARADADRRVPEYFTLLLNMNLALQWPVLAFCVAYNADIVQLIFGGKFIEYSWLLPVVIGFSTLNLVATPVTLVAQYEESAGVILLSKLFAVYNVLAMVTLLPLMGLYGAAIASGSAQALKNFFIWWHMRRRAVWLNAWTALPSAVAIWGGFVAVAWLLRQFLPAVPLVRLCAGAALAGIAVLIHLRSSAVAASDRRILSALFQGKEERLLRRLGLFALPEPGGTA